MIKVKFNTTKIAWEKKLFVKYSLTHLERRVRENASILKLQACINSSLKHLECHQRRNKSSLHLEVDTKFGSTYPEWHGTWFTSTVKRQEYAKFSLTYLHFKKSLYTQSETAGVSKIRFNTSKAAFNIKLEIYTILSLTDPECHAEGNVSSLKL